MTIGIGIVKRNLGKYTINLYVSVRSRILRFQEERLRMKKEDLGFILLAHHKDRDTERSKEDERDTSPPGRYRGPTRG